MSLLDGGIRDLFSAAFSGIYLDATLIKTTRSEDQYGDITETEATYPVKAHAPTLSAQYRAAGGYTDKELDIIVLQSDVGVTPTADDRITYAGKTYSIVSPKADGANSQWRIKCREWSNG